ncbi:protein translocase subunit secF [Calidifontibacter indicus]|uniref:Protein-export membrane protein SecF n=2 Tax=Calidifontibacter indicus TaxID=419650 RepID=A0A3D9V2G3_9MICO|nr:protein translocase subunit SecF [Calidifontibacter indicus]REF31301.1 protein translocase subunit secF [Calidifontibacter indicus]
MMSFAQFGNDLYTGRRQFDFVGRRRTWYAISIVLLVVAALGLLGRGINLSLEFKGGSELRVQGVTQMNNYEQRATDTVRKVTGSDDPISVTKLGTNQIRIQAKKLGDNSAATTDKVSQALATEFGVPTASVDSSYIGPSWGKTVTNKALIALVVFLVLVSVVLALYFRTWAMAFSALVALLHDLAFTVGIYALTGFEVSPATMIGFLTILGYSIYDTVVVFDKVRENAAEAFATGRRSYGQAANYAVNQTLVRSINTSVVALLPILSLLVVGFTLLGPGTLLDLALVLFVGIAVGTYSSIFIATPLLVSLRNREPAVQELARRAKQYQELTASDETGTAQSSSGVVDPDREKVLAEARAERAANKRELHPWATKDAE